MQNFFHFVIDVPKIHRYKNVWGEDLVTCLEIATTHHKWLATVERKQEKGGEANQTKKKTQRKAQMITKTKIGERTDGRIITQAQTHRQTQKIQKKLPPIINVYKKGKESKKYIQKITDIP